MILDPAACAIGVVTEMRSQMPRWPWRERVIENDEVVA